MEDGIFSNNFLKIRIFINLNFQQFLFLIIFLSSIRITEENPRNLINLSYEINLVIIGNGTQNLISDYFYLEPSKVIVNGLERDSCKLACELENEENNVTLYFNETVVSCYAMFYLSDNIKEIDLSNFDFSKVTLMSHMFRGCTNLEKINFGQANTSSVEDMQYAFCGCKKLTSIEIINTYKFLIIKII